MKSAVYPGSFDPVTLGHLNIIRRASRIFDKLYVCVAVNSAKNTTFTAEERVDFLKRSTARFGNVIVESSDELLVNYCRSRDIGVIVKGLRAVSDYENEFQMALINKKLAPDIDTMFMASDAKYTYLSSTVAKEMARYGVLLDEYIPREIVKDVSEKLKDGGK